LPKFTTAHYAAIVSTVAFLVSGASFLVSKKSYDLSLTKDERELRDKQPAVDLRIAPNRNASSADVTISIINRSDVNIAPQDIIVFPSLDAGEFYFSNSRQSVDKLKSSLSLLPMGSIAPKGTGTMQVKISGATDGKDDSFALGVELQFAIRIRFGDERDTLTTSEVVRRVKRTEPIR
jgi:hypothetical protein